MKTYTVTYDPQEIQKDRHDLVMSHIEKQLLEDTFRECGFNQTVAADVLGISRATLRYKLINYGVIYGRTNTRKTVYQNLICNFR